MMAEILGLRKTFSSILAIKAIILSFAFFCTLIIGLELQAQLDPQSETSNIDAVLILDASGSMRLTDPSRLRDEGAKAFIDTLKSGDRIAIVDFAEGAKEIRPLSDLSEKESIQADLPKAGDSGEYTDLLSGLTLARDILNKQGRENVQKVIVLLSDGQMDPKPELATPEAQIATLFSKEIPLLKGQGIIVHTLAFSELADQKLLAEIATLTGGVSQFTPNADGLKTAFVGISEAVEIGKKVEQVKTVSTFVGKVSRTFPVDPGIDEVTFYVNRGASTGITLILPTGESYDVGNAPANTKWFRGDDFDVITVTSPIAGDWGVSGIESKDNFATALTNLKLAIEWSNESVTVDEPFIIEGKFFESRKPITLPQLSSTLLYTFQVIPTDRISEPVLKGTLHDDGLNGDKEGGDGIFSTEISVKDEGNYKLVLGARGKTLAREQYANFKVTPRLLTLSLYQGEVAESSVSHGKDHGNDHGKDSHDHSDLKKEDIGSHDQSQQGQFFKVTLDALAIGIKEKSLKIKSTSSTHVVYNVAVPVGGKNQSEFIIPVDIIPTAGKFDVYAILGGKIRGRAVNTQSNLLRFTSTTKPTGAVVMPGAVDKPIHEDPHEVGKSKESGGSTLFGIIILTIINVICAALAIKFLKKVLSSVVVAEENYASPTVIIATLDKLKEKMGATSLDLSDVALSQKAIEQMLATTSGSEFDSALEENKVIDAQPEPVATEESPATEAPVAEEAPPIAPSSEAIPVNATIEDLVSSTGSEAKPTSDLDEQMQKLLDETKQPTPTKEGS